jgi:predicted negative regulator of RcsB-dependent stress response
MFSIKVKIIVASVILGLLAFAGYTAYTYNKGKVEAESKQVKAQLKKEIEVRKTYEKIDEATPYSADKHDSIKWLLNYGGRE